MNVDETEMSNSKTSKQIGNGPNDKERELEEVINLKRTIDEQLKTYY